MSPRLLPAALFFAASAAFAQQQPPKLEPLPEPPPPTMELDQQALDERGVKIEKGAHAEEFVRDGKRVIRVRRPDGRTYYLVEQRPGSGPRGHDPEDTGLRVPQWVLFEW